MKVDILESLKKGFRILKDNPIIFVPVIVLAILSFLISQFFFPMLPPEEDILLSGKIIEAGNTTATDDKFVRDIILRSTTVLILETISIMVISTFFYSMIIRMVYDATVKKLSLSEGRRIAVKKYPYVLVSSVICMAISGIGATVFVIPGIFLFIKLLYFDCAILIDDEKIINSLKKSWKITRGDWWTSFALCLLFGLLFLLLSLLPGLLSKFMIELLWVPWFTSSLTIAYLQLTERYDR